MTAVARARYRATQFFRALFATISADDMTLANDILGHNPAALNLFRRMSAHDRQHAIAVAKTLLADGYTDAALLQAALLHDVAKSLGQPIIHRVLVVLLERCCPLLLKRLARAPLDCARWRRPFVVSDRHPQIGAAWAKDAGCSPLVVQLIARHQQKPAAHPISTAAKFHAALYAADNQN